MKLKISKRPRIDIYYNEKRKNLKEYQSKSGRYVLLISQTKKESNRLTDLGKEIKSQNYLVCISKLPH